MSNVIDIVAHVDHTAGAAQCLGCGHEWTAVAPVGVQTLECPSCGLDKGTWAALCMRKDDEHLHCRCGCYFFHVTREGTYCPMCGTWQEF